MKATATPLVDRLRDLIKREHTDEHAFDRRYGIDTGGYLPIADQGLAASVHDYHGTPIHILRRLLRRLPPIDRARTVFIDYGAGLGRCLFVALEDGFARAIGIELCPEFHRRGLVNIQRARLPEPDRARLRLEMTDAREFLPPDEPAVLFLFNPFDAATTAAVAGRIAARHREAPQPRHLIYYNPWYREAFDHHPAYATVAEGNFKRRWKRHRYYPWVIYRLVSSAYALNFANDSH